MDLRLKEKIIALYESGMSLRDIGDSIGMSHQAVRDVIPNDMIRRKRMNFRKMRQVYNTFLKTDSYQETCDKHSLRNRQTVYRIVKIMEREAA